MGQIRFAVPKGSVEGSITSLNLSPSSLTLFLHFSSTAFALGSSAIVKVLGQNDTFVFWVSLQQMAFASQKVLWSVPQTVLYIISQSAAVLWASCRCFRKGSVEGSASYSLHLSSTWLLLHKSCLEGSANCGLHLSVKVATNPVHRNLPWAYFTYCFFEAGPRQNGLKPN